MRSHLLMYWPGFTKRFPEIYRYFYCPSCNWEMESNSLLLKSLGFSDTGPRVLCTGNDLKSPSIRTSFYDTRWSHASFQKRKSTNTPTQIWYLWTITTTCIAQYHKVFIHNKKKNSSYWTTTNHHSILD